MTTPTPNRRPGQQSGAEAIGGDSGGSKAAWLIPLLILLALLAALAIFLVARNAGDDGDKAGVDATNEPEGSKTAPAGETTTAPSEASDAASVSSTTAAATSTTAPETTTSASSSTPSGLVAGSTALVPPPSDGLGGLAGSPASGVATVESVVADEGFWVGSGPGQRVFVHLTPAARSSNGESPFQVEPGQRVTVEGTVTPAPADAAELGVGAAEGASELASLGGYIEASSIKLER